jgi:aspartate/methionine/tyrosine aminotransferase
MVYQETFEVERWVGDRETTARINISETCCWSLSIKELEKIIGKKFPVESITDQRLTYGEIPGSTSLRTTVAELHNESSKGPIKVTGDDVLITNGAIGANFLVYYALIEPGDHVVVVDPVYQQLKSVPAVFGGNVHLLELKPENDFLPDLEQLRTLVKANRPKLININSPHNPSGSVIPEEMLKEIVEIAREADAYLICDEVYRPLFHSLPDGVQTPSSVVSLYDKGIGTGSMSKAFGMAGLRLGWVVSPCKHVIEECLQKRDYNTISVGLVDDIIASWALTGRKQILEYNAALCRRNLLVVDEFVNKCKGKVSLFRPQGGTTMFLKIENVTDTTALCTALMEQYSTLIVPGETFGAPGFVRIGFANATDELQRGLENLYKYIQII